MREALMVAVSFFACITSLGIYGTSFFWLLQKIRQIESTYLMAIAYFALGGFYVGIAGFALSILESWLIDGALC